MDIAIRTAQPVASFGLGMPQPHPERDASRVTPVESIPARPDADSYSRSASTSLRPPGTDPSLPPQTLIDAALIGEAFRPKLTIEPSEDATPQPRDAAQSPAPAPAPAPDPREAVQPDEKTYMMVEKLA